MSVLSTGRFRPATVVALLIVILIVSTGVRASHIIGGDISMQAVGTKPGLFRLQLSQYVDAENSSKPENSLRLLVFRKQNPALIESIVLNLQETVPLTFANEACATQSKLRFSEARYYDNHQFNPSQYTDPGGYYIVWERCCRNDVLTNVNSAGADGVGMVFYLEFPPMTKSGAAFINSSPDFGIPNGNYICIGKPFTFNVGATDADGDQLRYSLVTPLNGYTNRSTPSVDHLPGTVYPSYPTVTWASGYGLTNVIPGNPSLSLNPTTGQLSVRASQEGLYLFTVQCEEFRNGVRIGVVRRDFQLPVVDCSKQKLPPSPITLGSKLATDTLWCASRPLVLAVERNPIWAYQWQKDGTNLRGATKDTLRVQESGVYTVVKSRANVCTNDTVSQAVKVTLTKGAPVTLSVGRTGPYCTGDTLTLRADGATDYQYNWRRDGQSLAGEKQPTLRINQPGQYTVLVKAPASVCGEGRDSLKLTYNARPLARINAPTMGFCAGDSLLISAATQSGNTYAWQQNSTRRTDTTSRIVVHQAGLYQVVVTAPTGCTAGSTPVTLTQYDRPVVRFDSIPPVCNTASAILLQGQPGGGVFTGPGVQGNRFDPIVAGIGRFTLTYAVTSDKGCRAEQRRQAAVSPGLTVTGQTQYTILKGDSVRLSTQADQPVSQYQWEPPASLNRTDVASPVARPLETTPYQLTAIDAAGCPATLSVLVDVVSPLLIPSAFTPNGDGMNDAWVIPNMGSFEQSEVWIYNRWGMVIFYSKGYAQPWDGTYRESPVETGVYTYQIQAGSRGLNLTYRGSLMVVH